MSARHTMPSKRASASMVWLTSVMVLLLSAPAYAQNCPGTSTPYNTTARDSGHYMMGLWASYFPGNTDVSTSSQNPSMTSRLHFDRLDPYIDLYMTGSSSNAIYGPSGGAVPGWMEFGPAAWLWKPAVSQLNWYDNLLFLWESRLIAPCTGQYTFETSADDGVALFIDGDLKSNSLFTGAWRAQAATTYLANVTLQAGNIYRVRYVGYENGGYVSHRLLWKLPGQTTASTTITSDFLIAHVAPRVYVYKNNVITFKSQTGVEELEVRLSEKPTGTVTVTIDNAAGKDMFGFSNCTLTFNEQNWNISQTVYAAPNPGPKRQPTDPITPVSLIATTDSAGKIFAPGVVQVMQPGTGGGNTLATCSGWGDPHYTTWDGATFNAYVQGTYYLARDYAGTFAVATVLRKCDATASVSCTKITYIKYKNSFFQVWMNPGNTTEAYKDGTPYWAITGGNGDGVTVDIPSSTKVRFTIPGGIEVQVGVGFYHTWEENPADWWRYHNVYVSVTDDWMYKVTGLCGAYDGNPTNDITNQTLLVNNFSVPDTFISTKGSSGMTSLTAPAPAVAPSFLYNTSLTIDKFKFDPVCSGVPLINPEPLDPRDDVIVTPDPIDPQYNPAPPSTVPTNDTVNFCMQYIDRSKCPGANSTTMTDSWITAQREHCAVEITLGGGLPNPLPPISQMAPLFAAFNELCSTLQDNVIIPCSTCKADQACVNNQCVSSGLECGGPCVTGTCNTVTKTCTCPTGYSGQFCEVPPSPTVVLCRIPSASELGPYVTAVVSNNTCALGSYITAGTTCQVQCGNGATGTSAVSYSCLSSGQLSRNLTTTTALQCEIATTCGVALASNLFTPCNALATVYNSSLTCRIGSPAPATTSPCGQATCCRSLTQCSSFSCAADNPLSANDASKASSYCDSTVSGQCATTCCRSQVQCSSYTCDATSFVNATAAGVYCDTATQGNCQSKCCIGKRACSSFTCPLVYYNSGSGTCSDDADCQRTCCNSSGPGGNPTPSGGPQGSPGAPLQRCGPGGLALIGTKPTWMVPGCICPSWTQDDWRAGECKPILKTDNSNLTIPGCPLTSSDVSQSNLVDLNTQNITAAMDGRTSWVEFNATLPALWGRFFKAVGITSVNKIPDPDLLDECLAENVFQSFKANKNDQTTCIDKWNIIVDFYELLRCGMKLNTEVTTPQYQVYDVNFKILYQEPVTIGADAQYSVAKNRTVVVDYPLRIFYKSEYSALLDSNVKVYTNYKIDFAVISQNIPKVNVSANSDATAKMYFQYAVQFPYAVRSLDTVYPGQFQQPDSTTPFNVSINGVAGGNVSLSGLNYCQVTRDYTPLAVAATNGRNATCIKSNNWLEFGGLGKSTSACRFGNGTSPYYYTMAFSLGCGTGVATIDCPLGLKYYPGGNVQASDLQYVTFNIRSENFCVGLVTQTINNAITISNLTAVSVFDYKTPQAGWRYNDKMFLRMDFTGLILTSVKLVALARKWSATDMSAADLSLIRVNSTADGTGYWTSTDLGVSAAVFLDDRATSIPNVLGNTAAVSSGGALYGKKLGLQLPAGNSYWFTVLLGQQFLGFASSTGPPSGDTLTRGEQRFLKMYATVQVTYPTTAAAGRRRRRQAGAEPGDGQGQGAIESSQSTLEFPEDQSPTAGVISNAAAVPMHTMSATAVCVLAIISTVLVS